MQYLVIGIIQVHKWTILRIQRNQYNPKNYLLRIWSLRSQCNLLLPQLLAACICFDIETKRKSY